MIKVGLLGEAPHDTNAIAALLSQHYGDQVKFVAMVNDIRGSQIEEQRVKRLLRKEYEIERPRLVIFIRDLDGLEGDREKVAQRKEYFAKFRSVVDGNGAFLLHIYAIEALVLADLEAYNSIAGASVPLVPDPMQVAHPEQYLKDHSDYPEGQLSQVLSRLRLAVIRSNCRYFETFFNDLISTIH